MRPHACAAAASISRPATESTATVTRDPVCSAAMRAHFAALTTSFAISTSSQNSATVSASPTVAHVRPMTIHGDLTPRDFGGLVRLEVRTHTARADAEELRQPRDVPLERRTIEHQGRSRTLG